VSKAKCEKYPNLHLQRYVTNDVSYAFVPPESCQQTSHLATYVYSTNFSGDKIKLITSKTTIDALYEALRVRSYGQAESQLHALITEVLARIPRAHTQRGLDKPPVNPVCVCFQRERAPYVDVESDLHDLEDHFQCFKVKLNDDGVCTDKDIMANIAEALTEWL
jgi:hypothetical protein